MLATLELKLSVYVFAIRRLFVTRVSTSFPFCIDGPFLRASPGVTDYGVTVKAEDQGSPSLAGFCTFRVKIGDKNDNPPVFDFPDYETSIEEASPIGKRVMQVRI